MSRTSLYHETAGRLRGVRVGAGGRWQGAGRRWGVGRREVIGWRRGGVGRTLGADAEHGGAGGGVGEGSGGVGGERGGSAGSGLGGGEGGAAGGAGSGASGGMGAWGSGTLRVLCVDDNPHVCEALRLRLDSEDGFSCAAVLDTAAGLVAQAVRLEADAALVDIDMPGPDPFAAVAELARVRPSCRVVMFTGHVRRELIDRALDAGAWGYISKQDGPDAVIAALKRVANGEVVLGDDVGAVYGAG